MMVTTVHFTIGGITVTKQIHLMTIKQTIYMLVYIIIIIIIKKKKKKKKKITMNLITVFTISPYNTYALMLDDFDSIQPIKDRERIIIKSTKDQ